MKLIFKLIFLALFLVFICFPVAIVFLCIDERPLFEQNADLTFNNIKKTKNILNENRPKRLYSNQKKTIIAPVMSILHRLLLKTKRYSDLWGHTKNIEQINFQPQNLMIRTVVQASVLLTLPLTRQASGLETLPLPTKTAPDCFKKGGGN